MPTLLLLFLLVWVTGAEAHHSFAAEFDSTKPITLTGSVVRLEWGNPHIWVYFDVRDERGAFQRWQCEGNSPNVLTRNGWSKDSLKPNDQITVEGFLARDGSRTCSVRAVTLADGRKVFAGAASQ